MPPEPHLNEAISPGYLDELRAELFDKFSVEQRMQLASLEGGRKSRDGAPEVRPALHQHILEVLAADAERRVRQALAETLAENPTAPHDVVLALAKDEALVAAPVLRLSEVLTPEDLIAIIGDQPDDQKMDAIADRKVVPPAVCDALVARSGVTTVDRLLRNPGAEILEPSLNRIVDRFGDREEIQTGIVNRAVLPATIVERAIALLSSDLIARLMQRHQVPEGTATKLALATRERATLGLTAGLTPENMARLVDQLAEDGKLTDSLLIRGLCVGNLDLVVQAIASWCSTSPERVRARLMESTQKELREFLRTSGLSTKVAPVVEATIGILKSSADESAKWNTGHYRSRIVQRLITGLDDLSLGLSAGEIEDILAVVDGGDVRLDDFIP